MICLAGQFFSLQLWRIVCEVLILYFDAHPIKPRAMDGDSSFTES
jgi:hypothetical protein